SRRHPSFVASSLVLLLMAVVGLSIGAALLASKQVEVERQRREAEANFRLARDAVDRMLTEVGAASLAGVPQMTPVRQALLREALAFYLEFLRRRRDDPAILLEAGRAHRRVGDI